jgi:ATP-dependent RNA helicase DeaD
MSESSNPFAELGLRAEIVETLAALGYEAPTPIQQRTIPLLLSGSDMIGQAQTGTGKTAAFALPILEKIDPKKKETQALVLTPTRELAMQVADAIHSYSANLGTINVLPVYGGAPIVPQLKRLERGVHVVVGTPGRLIDHLDRGSLDLSKIRMLVLDEADEMLKMGFAEEVEKILAAAPAERQIALFSATMPEEVLRVAKRHLRNPERVDIEHKAINAPAIEQRFLNVSEGQKLEVLTQILELQPAEAVLIFRRTKTGSAELAEKLEGRGFAAVAMHGDMSQPLRESVIRRLRAGQVEIVVATDVAARGLDVEQIEHVINYDVPYDVEAYVHRIGRTGRAGRSGLATMFITPRERKMMREIERYTGTQIKPMKMPTRADIAAKRIGVFKDSIRKTIGEGDLEMYLELVEQLVEEGPFDIADIAAAAARIANGSRSLVKAREQEINERVEPQPREAPSERSYAPRPTQDSAPSTQDSPGEKTIRLQMSVGRNDGIRPADVVGSIANEADIPGRDIGPIDIQDDVTYVGVPQRYVDVVLEKVGKKRFRGRAVNLKVAPPESFTQKRPYRSDAPKKYPPRDDAKSFVPREGARSYTPREGAKPYAPRDAAKSYPPRKYAPAARPGARDDRPPRDDRPAPRKFAGPGAKRDDRLPGREYSPRTPKPFYTDVKKGFKGKKKK